MDPNGNDQITVESLRFESLSKRVYFAARDGLAITLYALLSEASKEEQAKLLNQVSCLLDASLPLTHTPGTENSSSVQPWPCHPCFDHYWRYIHIHKLYPHFSNRLWKNRARNALLCS